MTFIFMLNFRFFRARFIQTFISSILLWETLKRISIRFNPRAPLVENNSAPLFRISKTE